MSEAPLHDVLKLKLVALVREFAQSSVANVLSNQAALSVGHTEFEAMRDGETIASVELRGGEITFQTHHGVFGCLYPAFELGSGSLRTTATGEKIDLAQALRIIRVCFRTADDVRIVDDSDSFDGEVFVVDPDTSRDLIEQYQT